jgi:predicted acyltransferase
LSGALPRLLALIRIPNGVSDSGKSKFLTPFNWVYEKICKPLFEEPRNGSFLYALLFICLMWLIAWWMDKKKIYIKV